MDISLRRIIFSNEVMIYDLKTAIPQSRFSMLLLLLCLEKATSKGCKGGQNYILLVKLNYFRWELNNKVFQAIVNTRLSLPGNRSPNVATPCKGRISAAIFQRSYLRDEPAAWNAGEGNIESKIWGLIIMLNRDIAAQFQTVKQTIASDSQGDILLLTSLRRVKR